MVPRSKLALLLWLLAVVLVPIRSANAHLHMCLDGQKQAVAMHLFDVPTHDGAHLNGHTDRDIQLDASLSTSKLKSVEAGSIAVWTSYVIALLVPAESSDAPPATVALPLSTPLLDLLPPSRGPPV